jgi:membrane dipeptidase
MTEAPIPVFDGHNDVLWRLWSSAGGLDKAVKSFTEGAADGHIDAIKARKGGLAGGLCAIYVPSDDQKRATRNAEGHYGTPLAGPLERGPSLDIALQMAHIALEIERAGGWRLCRSGSDIDAAMADNVFAAVLHLEGCEPIGADLSALSVLHAAGLRSLGPVWSRNNIFAHGVPFAFPKSPDTGPGLTDLGKALVRECDRLGILVDCAHITEKGFWDIAETSENPLIVSHSNAHALTPVARNLTDKQLDAVRERNGIVGLNYAVSMLRADGAESPDTPIEDMLRHIDYLVERVGIDGVALGSDFDGAMIPAAIGSAAGLPALVRGLEAHGITGSDLEKLCRGNWRRIIGRVIG